MDNKQLRAFARKKPKEFLRNLRGSRNRDLIARHLLLHPEQIPKAPNAARAALSDYVLSQRWRSLYNHDRRMYRILRAAALKLKMPTEP
jgi:hypothetical protein